LSVQTVGLVGLGLLGSAIAERLLAAGIRVVGYDLLEARRRELAAAGGETVESATEVVRRADVVVLSLPDSNVVAALIASLAVELRRGTLVIDTSTGDPQAAEALGAQLAERGIEYLDATVAGSSAVVRAGEAILMVGGSDAALQSARPVLDCFGRKVIHVGPCGSGSRMKLVVNLVLGLNRAVLAEGFTLAAALGLDPATTLATLQAGAAYSRVMDAKGQKMLTGDFSPQARLSQHLKDVRLMLEAAQRTGVELPLSKVHRQLLERAEALGLGELDNSAILRAFEP
jgi:3-hydroxyisobutyrate dehydrogenase-like beta-hydroxyacid dehydrogenase